MACVVFECKSHSSNKADIEKRLTFHRFPQDANLREAWIKAISRKDWEPTRFSRVCSKHFTKDSYIEGRKIRMLKRNAVPTVFENYPVYMQKESKKVLENHLMEVRRQTNLKIRQARKARALDEPSTGTIAALTKESVGDSPKSIKLKRVLKKQFQLSSSRLKKLKALEQKCDRLKRTLICYQNLVDKLKSKTNILIINVE